ncbi:hypothetical protein CDD83_8205 [Cordyceps sp. RAO-2017]|nr:hypothetical protein CDD83_8205 [Cordyceps sp. RAO-2017]
MRMYRSTWAQVPDETAPSPASPPLSILNLSLTSLYLSDAISLTPYGQRKERTGAVRPRPRPKPSNVGATRAQPAASPSSGAPLHPRRPLQRSASTGSDPGLEDVMASIDKSSTNRSTTASQDAFNLFPL